MAKKPLGQIIVVVLLGAMIGTLFGHLLGLVLPEGVVKDFFLKSAPLEVGPITLDVVLFAVTLGFKITFNIVGLLGIGVAMYFFRWY